jgi:hypothetical protein
VGTLLVTSCGDSSKSNNDNSHASKGDGGSDTAAAGHASSAGDDSGTTVQPQGGNGNAEAGAGGDASAPQPNPATPLGRHCSSDSDCGQGLKCLSASQDYPGGVGAPSGGFCTLSCDQDATCQKFDPTAVCGSLDEAPIMLATPEEPLKRLCLQGCWFGEPSGQAKCHGQLDQACRPFAPPGAATCFQPDDVCPDNTFCFRGTCREAACGPRCNRDADCAPGRVCDPGSGLCDEQAPPAVPIGGDCPGDLEPETNACGSGTCLLLSADGLNVKRMCTQTCTLGTLCGEDGACVLPRLQDYAAGDIGYCLERCNCDADCKHPLDKCFEWSTASLALHFKSRGVCDTPFSDDDPSLVDCQGDPLDGGAGGAGGASGAAGQSGAGGADRGQGGQPG